MRKCVLFIAALLLMAVPAMAVPTVNITCDVNNADKMVTVSYEVTGSTHLVRAFALDINVTEGVNITDVCVVDPCYRIFPGQIVIKSGSITDYNTPYAPGDVGDSKVTVEMASLYTTDANYEDDANAGYYFIPETNGILLTFHVDGDCTYTVDQNMVRGGIVMEDPTEVPGTDSPLCSGTIPKAGEEEYYDFGDAPQSYSTKMVDVPPGPNHLMATATTGIGPILGALIDAEGDGQPSVNCDLDDNTGVPDDEDGITNLVAVANIGVGGSVTVTVSQACQLDAWIDWGNDGNFAQAGDQIVFNEGSNLSAGPNPLTFAVPSAGVVLNTPLVSRWRVSSAGGLSYNGPASDGEVEDYRELTVVCGTCPYDIDGDGWMTLNDFYYILNLLGRDGCVNYECDMFDPLVNPPITTQEQCLDTDGDLWLTLNDFYYVLNLLGRDPPACFDYECQCPIQ